MASIALIGGDGAGKTSVTRHLLEERTLPYRYLYMGINVESSNVALPTSRLIVFLKRRRSGRRRTNAPTTTHAAAAPRKGKLRATLRLVHRLTEEWYRQGVSWWHQLRGRVVLYDRHFLFDFHETTPPARLSDRIHLWMLRHAYPAPGLVLFLDAPPEVLMARKGEATLEFHAARREAMLDLGRHTRHFVRIDATQPLDKVCAEVSARAREYCAARRSGRALGSARSNDAL